MASSADGGIQARVVPPNERKLQDVGFAGCFGVFMAGVFALGFNSIANASSVGEYRDNPMIHYSAFC